MANIVYNAETKEVTFEGLQYVVLWYESLGSGSIHIALSREGQNIVQCYQAGDCSVNDVAIATVPEILAALDSPELYIPEQIGVYTFE